MLLNDSIHIRSESDQTLQYSESESENIIDLEEI